MSHLYRTNFILEVPVTDFCEADSYLREDDMTQYLWDNHSELNEVVIHIEWYLIDDESGCVDVETTRELTEDESRIISNFISGQNSDGLGEGFEQQSFACYEEDGVCYMASFDWRDNDYILEEVK